MYYSYSSYKKSYRVTYLLYDRETETFGNPLELSFYSSSKNNRNLNDIAARYARNEGIEWDKLIIRDAWNNIITERKRMFYTH